MGYRGLLKPNLRWPMAIGFLVGSGVGATLTFRVIKLCQSGGVSGEIYYCLTLVLALPAALLHTTTEAAVVCVNGAIAGLGTAVAVRLLGRRWLARPSEQKSEVHLPGRSLKSRVAVSALAGFIAVSLGTAVLAELSAFGGELWQYLVLFPITAPSRALCRLLQISWSNEFHNNVPRLIFTFGIAPAIVNGLIGAVLCGSATALRNTKKTTKP